MTIWRSVQRWDFFSAWPMSLSLFYSSLVILVLSAIWTKILCGLKSSRGRLFFVHNSSFFLLSSSSLRPSLSQPSTFFLVFSSFIWLIMMKNDGASPRFLCAFCARECHVRPHTYTIIARVDNWLQWPEMRRGPVEEGYSHKAAPRLISDITSWRAVRRNRWNESPEIDKTLIEKK